MQTRRRIAIRQTAALALAVAAAFTLPALAADAPGVSATEIRIGATFPFSGPASALGVSGKGLIGYVNSINDRGGINGRKINLIALDDGYAPPKTVEMTRRLIENDEVAFLFGPLGTPGISATVKYVNSKKVPHLFVTSGATKFSNFNDYPYTTTGLVAYSTEGRIYADYIDQQNPGGKVGLLYQNDDLGKDFLSAFKDHFKADFDKRVVAVSYETTDPTVDSQIVSLKSAGAQSVMLAGTPKFVAQAIKKVHDLGWKPLVVIDYISTSVATVIVPAGVEKAIGVISGTYVKDPTDKKWEKDPGMQAYRAYFAKYFPGDDIADGNYQYGTNQGIILEHVLKLCGNDLSRENIVKQARSIKGLVLPTALPGIVITTGPQSSMAYTQLQLQRWTGSTWEQFGEVRGIKAD